MMRIVVNTPNGKVGRKTVFRLLQAGAQVVMISRHPEKVQDLAARGAKLVQGSIEEGRTLSQAFSGADAVFWVHPPNYRPNFQLWTEDVSWQAAELAKASGIKRAVVLSSAGAQAGPGVNGPVGTLRLVEEAFQSMLPNTLVLRAGYFMENFFNDLSSMASDGNFYSPIPSEQAFPMVATQDIAERVAGTLINPNWSGSRVTAIQGPADLSLRQAGEIFSQAFGQPVRPVQVTLEQARQAMLQAGMPDYTADLYVEMLRGFVEGRMTPAEPRSKETSSPTTLREFAETDLKPAFEVLVANIAKARV